MKRIEESETKRLKYFENISVKYGIISGAAMSGLLLMFQISGNDYSPFLKLSNYLILALAIVSGLIMYEDSFTEKRTTVKGISVGHKLSSYAGVVLVLINILLYLILPAYSFSKFGVVPSTIFNLLAINAMLFFETLIIGMVITFAALQFLKEEVRL